MPKAYSAPIPIYRELGVGDRDFEPARRYPWPEMDRSRIKDDYLRQLPPSVSIRDRTDLEHIMRRAIAHGSPEWGPYWDIWELSVKAHYVLTPMGDIRNLASWAADEFEEDVLGVDDFFLTFCNPRVDDHLEGLVAAVDRGSGADYLGRLATMTDEWPLNKGRLEEIAGGGAATYACWHPRKGHSEIKRRGRQWTSARRANAWATYCFAWLCGSESLAVRLWNACGEDTHWGTDDPNGIKTYGVAKHRLVESLSWAMGVAVIPPSSWARPYDPLPSDVFDKVLQAIQPFPTWPEDANGRTTYDIDSKKLKRFAMKLPASTWQPDPEPTATAPIDAPAYSLREGATNAERIERLRNATVEEE